MRSSVSHRLNGNSKKASLWAGQRVCSAIVLLSVALSAAEEEPQRSKFESGYTEALHKVTITGTIKRLDGTPVIGAKFFLIPRNGDYVTKQLLGTTRSRKSGDYEFREVSLPVREYRQGYPQQGYPYSGGCGFQIAAVSDEIGWTWRQPYYFRPERRPDNLDNREVFYDGEPIRIDLVATDAARLRGRVTNEEGQPVAGAKVQVGLVNSTTDVEGIEPRWGGCNYWEAPWSDDSVLHYLWFVPEEFRATRTDINGNYDLPSLPRNVRTSLFIDSQRDYVPWTGTIVTTDTQNPRNAIVVGRDGRVDHVFERLTPLSVVVTRAADSSPVVGALVRAEVRTFLRDGYFAQTDVAGRATLLLPPDQYRIAVDPIIDQALGTVRQPITVVAGLQNQLMEIALPALGKVVVSVVTNDCNRGVADVRLRVQRESFGDWQYLQSRPGWRDHPRSQSNGQLTALLPPGRYRFAVDRPPPGYQLASLIPDWITVEAESHHQTSLFLTAPHPVNDGAKEPEDLNRRQFGALEKQLAEHHRLFRGSLQLRQSDAVSIRETYAELSDFMSSLSTSSLDDALARFQERFPESKRLISAELIVDRERRRWTSGMNAEHPLPRTESVFNGEVFIHADHENHEIDIAQPMQARLHLPKLDDFWKTPISSLLLLTLTRSSSLNIQRSDGTILLSHHSNLASQNLATRLVVDEPTGFLRQSSKIGADGSTLSATWQLFPSALANGLNYPQMNVAVQADQLTLTLIDSVQSMDEFPPETFVISADPATTLFVSAGDPYQHPEIRPPGRRVKVFARDVAELAATWTPPRIKVGDFAPNLLVDTWVGPHGEMRKPETRDKIKLIVFWAMNSGTCVTELPEIGAAAREYVGSDLAVIGLHEASASVEELSAFARKHELAYPLGIGQVGERGIDESFAVFDVRAIPAAIVVDRRGKIAFIGQISGALSAAKQCLAQP